ncbi:MAG: hypothetical protein DMG00_03340 [Acidobacteria bacterium]|nr:MAG: hypothetical protein DMG00_03340 [Acidobacteriota bacterium]
MLSCVEPPCLVVVVGADACEPPCGDVVAPVERDACELPCDDVVLVVGADACEPCVVVVAATVVCELLPCEVVAGWLLLPWPLPSACTAATDNATIVIAQKVIRAIRIDFLPAAPRRKGCASPSV